MTEFLVVWAHGAPASPLDLTPWPTVAGAVVRFVQAGLDNAPYLLCGVVVSSLLRGVVGAEVIRRRLGAPSLTGVLTASISGLLLPLGALGALPVARQLRTMGVPRGTALAFLLSGAVVDPLSLILGLSLMGTGPVVGCVVACLAWSLACGLLVNRLAPGVPQPNQASVAPPPITALGRLSRVVSTMMTEFSGPSLRDLMIAAAGAAILGAWLPSGWLQEKASPDHMTGSFSAAVILSIAGETSLDAMRMTGVILRDGTCHRIAFPLFALSSGLNLAVLVWLARGMKRRPHLMAGVLMIGLMSCSLLGWGFDRQRQVPPIHPPFHTHAFDEIGRPNFSSQGVIPIATEVGSILAKSAGSHPPALLPMILFVVVGVITRQPRVRTSLSRWVERWETPRSQTQTRAWERPLSSRWTATLGLVATTPVAIALLFTYYPAPEILFDEMVPVYTEVQYELRHGNTAEALAWVERWEDLIRKLGPARILRHGSLGPEPSEKLDVLFDHLSALRKFLEEGRLEEAQTLVGPTGEAQRDCRDAFDAARDTGNLNSGPHHRVSFRAAQEADHHEQLQENRETSGPRLDEIASEAEV